MVAASVVREAARGSVFAIMPSECVPRGTGCICYAVYMYSDENSAVSEATSGMIFLSMNAQ
jgi:hypothetical protein